MCACDGRSEKYKLYQIRGIGIQILDINVKAVYLYKINLDCTNVKNYTTLLNILIQSLLMLRLTHTCIWINKTIF